MKRKKLVLIWGLLLSMSMTDCCAYASEKDMVNDLASMPDTITITYNNYTLKGEGTGNTRFGEEWEAEHLLPYVLFHKDGNIYPLYDTRYEDPGASEYGVYYFKDNESGGIELKAGKYYIDSDGNYHSTKGKDGEDKYYWTGSDWVLYENAEAEDNRFAGQLEIRDATTSDDTIYNKVYLLDGKDIHPDQLKYWDPACFTSTVVSKEWFKEHSGEQTENQASVSTLYNHPEMRKAVEDLLGLKALYGSDKVTKSGASSSRLGTMIFKEGRSFSKELLAEDSSGEELRDKLAAITSEKLGLEGNLPCSWAVPLYIYYNVLDNNRGLLELPSSLNDSISKRDFISLNQSTLGEFDTKADEIAKDNADIREMIEQYKDLQAAKELGKKLAKNPYEEAALGAYFAQNCKNGNYYGREDANQESLNSKMTRLEALYNMSDMDNLQGTSTGWHSIWRSKFDTGGVIELDNIVAVMNLLGYDDDGVRNTVNEKEGSGIGPTRVYIDFSLDELNIDDVKVNRDSDKWNNAGDRTLDGVIVFGTRDEKDSESQDSGIIKNVISSKKVAVGKQKISRTITVSKPGKGWVDVKEYKYQKKVNGKVKYKWSEKKPGKGWKLAYKIKYKTVEKTDDILRIGFSEVNYTKKNIEQLKCFLYKYFKDGSDYHMMTVEEIAEAKEKVDYYKVWALEGRSQAQALFNSYAMSKHMLTPEAAIRIIFGYECGLFVADENGNLNLFSEVTWGDALTWITMKLATDTIWGEYNMQPLVDGLEHNKIWSGYEKYTNQKEYQWDNVFNRDMIKMTWDELKEYQEAHK